ncbi:hypothetical protein OQJ13_02800 [Legionella sp. PATHC035]|uniref:hypothetical protein n=1 Tax=Legionella sp. PATHC035 TaxID=2992040 RepID=UPI002243E2AD|nr:hypothetical protein [Legionella sp. PATHC035]MCW8407897.1 hypothetical protein [Legionella sp. PATHC035]
MPKNYFSSKDGTVTKRLDEAWSDYRNSSLSKEDRLNALDFMIYVFDIKKLSNKKNVLNELLDNLMREREKRKKENPDYIPVLSRGKYKLEPNRVLKPTSEPQKSSEADIQTAFNRGELLDVNEKDKRFDKAVTTFLTPQQRAEFNIEINNGLFHKEGKIFDSSQSIAHKKPGFVAFTLNTNYELSVFEHQCGLLDEQGRLLLHSSMNAGAPVLAAGEMEIKNGKLISINTYSGHYQPSLYSVARFLEYLSNRGVDITETKLYLENEPSKETGLKYQRGQYGYEISANDIVHSVKKIMTSNLEYIDEYINSSRTKLFNFFGNKLTKAKSAIAQEFHDELVYTMDTLKDSISLSDVKISIECLDSIITRYSEKLKQLAGNPGRLDNKFSVLNSLIQEQREKYEHFDDQEEEQRIECFKSQH